MSKWRKYYASKYEFPTVGTLVGHKTAEREIVRKLGRPLREGWKVVTKAGNWCFMEPKIQPEDLTNA